MTYVVLFAFMLVAIISIYRLKLGYYLWIISLPFTPRYLAIAVGDQGYALSLRRLIVYFLAVMIIISVARMPKQWRYAYDIAKSGKWFVYPLLIFYMITLVSTMSNGGLFNVLYWSDEILIIFITMLLTFRYVTGKKELLNVLSVILVSLFISELFAAVENQLQRPLLHDQMMIEVMSYGKDALEGRERSGAHRVQVGYDNPISFAEYVCATVTFCIAFIATRRVITTGVVLIIALIAPIAVFVTYSHIGFVVLFILVISLIAFWKMGRLRETIIFVVAFILLSQVHALFLFGAERAMIIADYVDDFRVTFTGATETHLSTMIRANQYVIIPQLVSENALLGFGMKRNYVEEFDEILTLDSNLLLVLLEGGWVGLTMQLIANYYLFMLLVKLYEGNKKDAETKKILLALFGSLLALTIYKFAVAIPANQSYYYFVAAVLLILNNNTINISRKNSITRLTVHRKATMSMYNDAYTQNI